MKNIIFSSFLILFLAQGAIGQSITNTSKLTDDEVARVKFSLHLINYQTPPNFDNAIGQAYYNVINASFSENLIIPTLTVEGLSEHDKTIVTNHIELLNGSIANPLTWEHLLLLETQYQKWIDMTTRKASIYKN